MGWRVNRQFNRYGGVHALMAQGLPHLRALIALMMLVIFSTQTYLIQTHIHARATTSATQSVTNPSGKAPLDADQCPLCQEAAHSGAYILPGVAALVVATVTYSLVPLTQGPRIFVRSISHTWQGRAPPQK